MLHVLAAYMQAPVVESQLPGRTWQAPGVLHVLAVYLHSPVAGSQVPGPTSQGLGELQVTPAHGLGAIMGQGR